MKIRLWIEIHFLVYIFCDTPVAGLKEVGRRTLVKPFALAACVISALVTHPKNYPELNARLEAALGLNSGSVESKRHAAGRLSLRTSKAKTLRSTASAPASFF